MKTSKRQMRKIALIATLALCGFTLFVDFPSYSTKRLASIAENTGDVSDPLLETDTPLYWHIFKSGGSSMKTYYSCLGLVISSQQGIMDGHIADKTIQVWERVREGRSTGNKYVNVDTTNEAGMARAKRLGLAESGLADIVFAPRPPLASNMFYPDHQGRFFGLFRHPIERAVSLFYYHQIASWERNSRTYRPELKGMTIEEWVKRNKKDAEINNYMTSSLLSRYPRNHRDLEDAKEILRTKFLVGLVSRMEESVERFDKYFGWYDIKNRQQCQERSIIKGINRNPHDGVEESSEAWNLLADMNKYDVQLYEYVVQLYEEQRELFDVSAMTKVKQ